MKNFYRGATAAFGVLLALVSAETARAGDGPFPSVSEYFANWFQRVAATQAEQPHWAPPIATTSPCLQEVFRYDISQQTLANGHTLTSYGFNKGLELIPSEHVQIIIGLPSWQTQDTTPRKNGWADESFLVKYRLLAANEENGNYVVTTYMGMTVPNGSDPYSMHHYTFSPTLAAGKGWGDLDLQGSVGMTIPDNGAASKGAGTPFLMNAILQYRIMKTIWPEVEANYTYWPNGVHAGLNQLLVTPGVILGKFPIWERLGVMMGAGYQVAVTDRPVYHHNILITARFPF